MIPFSEKTLDVTAYRSKTDTWLRSREKVEMMLQNISEEANSKQPIPFSFFGRKSLLTKEMEFFETDNPDLLQMQKEEPEKLAELFSLKEELTTFLQDRVTWRNSLPGRKFYDNLGKKLDPFLAAYSPNPFLNIPLGISKIPVLVITVPLGLPSLFYEGERAVFLQRQAKKNEKILNLINDHVKKIVQTPNSCFTWAKEKLELIDVEMPESRLDKFISISTLYANHLISPPSATETSSDS